jgi:hypothetical protein
MHARNMPYIFGKISIRVIVFLETSLQFEVCTTNYGHPK